MGNLDSIILGGVTLPVPTYLREVTTPNEGQNVTLDGTIYTDFVNVRRTWEMGWAFLCKEDFDLIRAVFDDQYALEAFPTLEIDYYDVLTPVKMSINTKEIRWDGNQVAGFQITLQERFAIS